MAMIEHSGKESFLVYHDMRVFFDELTDQINDMPAYTQILAIICRHFYGYNLMNYDAKFLPEKGFLLHNFHDLLDELGFSFSDDAFYELMTGTHSVYRKDEEASGSDGETDEYLDIDTDTDTDADDISEGAELSDIEMPEEAEAYSDAA